MGTESNRGKIKMKSVLKLLICLYVLTFVNLTFAQECFFPAHNYVSGSDDLTSGTYWTKPSTVTDDTATTNPPPIYNITKTFKGVGTAGQSNFLYGNTLNAYVTNGTNYVISAYVKYSNFQYLRFGVTGSGTYAANFDIQNGSYTGTATGISDAGVESVGDGWYKIYGTYTGAPGTISKTFRFVFTYIATGSGTGSTMAGGETFYVTAPQAILSSVTSPENKKYVATTAGFAVWSTPRVCDAVVRSETDVASNHVSKVTISNRVLYSEQFDNAAWTKSTLGVTADTITAPNGTITADTVTLTSATTNGRYVYPTSTITVGNTNSRRESVYLKAGTHNYVHFYSQYPNTAYVDVDLSNGSILRVGGTNTTQSVTDVGDGWYLVSFTHTPSSSSALPTVQPLKDAATISTTSWTSAGTETFYVWGASLQEASFSSEYLLTTSAGITLTSKCWAGYAQSLIDTTKCYPVEKASLGIKAIHSGVVTQAAADKAWATTTRTITGGTVSTNSDKTGYGLATDAVNSTSLATTAVTEIKDGTLGAAAEGTYAGTTFGGYIEKIKKYVANKMTISGSAYTIKDDDQTTTYETGTTDATGRDPS